MTHPHASPDTLVVHTDLGPLHLPAGSTVAQAFDALCQRQPAWRDGTATAVNGRFVPRTLRSTQVLQGGDTLLCFTAITGG